MDEPTTSDIKYAWKIQTGFTPIDLYIHVHTEHKDTHLITSIILLSVSFFHLSLAAISASSFSF